VVGVVLEGAAARLARAVAAVTRRTVGDDLVGLYVIGSTAQGDATPSSDLDVMAIVRGDGAHAWVDELAEGVATVAEAASVPRTEYVVYCSGAVSAPRYPLPYVLNVNAGPGEPRHVSVAGDPPHWFLLDVAMAREHAVTLIGPPADTLLGEPGRADVAQAIRAALDWHETSADDDVSTVLNSCRAWRFLAGDGWSSKTAAGRWAAARWDGTVVDDARRARARGRAPRLDREEVSALVAHVRELARW
jgi:hypothetical protein